MWEFAKSIYNFKLEVCAQKMVKNASLIFKKRISYISYGLGTETHGIQWAQNAQTALPIGGKNT